MYKEEKTAVSNIKSQDMQDKYDEAIVLFHDAVAKRSDLVDKRFEIRNNLYNGKSTPIDSDSKGTAGDVPMNKCHRNMCFELIESQINNGQPMPKITPARASKVALAHSLEKWIRNEMDRLDGEAINDRVERGVLKQGTHYYMVGWDDTVKQANRRGAITITELPIQCVWPQPGIKDFKDADYVFVKNMVSKRKLRNITGFNDIPESPNYKGLVETVTYWYYDDEGYVCRFVWVDNTEYVLFDDRDYESRRVRTCKHCGKVTSLDVCPECGSKEFVFKPARAEVLEQDIVRGDPSDPTAQPLVLAKAGDEIPYYAIKRIPIVCRVNVSDDNSMYGISDIDILETNQKTCNAVTSKIEQNILKAGSMIVLPSGLNMKLNNETLKVVRVKDPKMAQAIDVKNLQANIQQDDILSERAYQYGRASLGITDSYQGKRDPTAESGKAKEIAAAQSAGRLESKRRMKDAAYADLYYLMFQYFLAYDDVKERVLVNKDDGTITSSQISRYDFLDGKPGDVYYDDSFMFAVDTASVLYTSRESMWTETTANFQAGTMGNPQDPTTLMLYWSVMSELDYPLAQKCLNHITEVLQQQQAMAQQQAMVQQQAMMEAQKQQSKSSEGAPQQNAAPQQKQNSDATNIAKQIAERFNKK